MTITTLPRRVQRSRAAGWRMPEGAIYVGRPTKWGNPFGHRTYTGLARVPGGIDPAAEWEYEGRVSADGDDHDIHHPDGRVTRHKVRYMTRAECVETHRRALLGDPTPSMLAASPGGRFLGYWTGPVKSRRREYVTPEMVRAELAGRDLACWCPLSEACHADVLLAVANGVLR